jgi:DtxR family manganese transport transcriptional regulator
MTRGAVPKVQPFRRTRNDHASETAEDYVEAIANIIKDRGVCRGADLARMFGVSHVTITKTVSRLKQGGLVETSPYAPLRLTRKGEKLAWASRTRHELVLQFLIALGVSHSTAEADSEGIEHHVSEETLRAFRKFILER